jgi:predicted regulator of Ras-like GTPase activity (Roadblock/LC7/MglB family)
MLRRMDAAQALADLTEISSQVVHVAIVGGDGTVLATTIADAGRAGRFVQGVTTLLEEADSVRLARGLPGLSQLEAATHEGSVFVVRRESEAGGTRIIAATTRPDPTVGLVFYDLKHCLRSIDDAGEANGSRRRTRKKAGDAA